MTALLILILQWTAGIVAACILALLIGYYITSLSLWCVDIIKHAKWRPRNPFLRVLYTMLLGACLGLLYIVAFVLGVPTYLWDWFLNHTLMTLLMGWDTPKRFPLSQGYCYTVTLRFRYYRTPEYRKAFPRCWRTWVASHVCDCWLNWADPTGRHC